MRHRSGNRVMIIALLAGMGLAGYGPGVTLATAAPPLKEGALGGVTQNWDKVIAGTMRFTVLGDFNNAAVRDNETGLVWEQSPDTTPDSWLGARGACANKNVGGRKGWRLPSLPELSSLIDPGISAPGPTLPMSHPFTNIQINNAYWSGSTVFGTNAWEVSFFDGQVRSPLQTSGRLSWCVRGGVNTDAYRD